MAVEGPDIKEEIQDKFRQYYLDYKKQNNTFPSFPEDNDFYRSDFKFGEKPKTDETKVDAKDAAKGGESLISLTCISYFQLLKRMQARKAKTVPARTIRCWNSTLPTFCQRSKMCMLLSKLKIGSHRFSVHVYNNQWREKDETNNLLQKHDQEIVKREKRIEVELEVRYDVSFHILLTSVG